MHLHSLSKTLLLSALFSLVSFSAISSMELIAASSVSSAEPVKLFRNHKDLFVEDELAAYRVEKHNMNPLLHEVMKRQAMGNFTEKGGYLRVKQLNDGTYLINANVRGDGGTGPITAGVVGFAVRFGCYTAYLLGTSGTVVVGSAVGGPGGAAAAGGAITIALTQAGGAAGVIAATEKLAMEATLATLLLPIPLP